MKEELEQSVKTSPTISVIVPVYNAEKYLHRCIDSVLAQTYKDFELLLIDDGSKDSSGTICDEYAAQDARVKVFHKENGGVSSARNVGLDHAQGEWVTFVDSDDWVSKDYLEEFDFCTSEIDLHCCHIQVEGWKEWVSYPFEDKAWDKMPEFLSRNLHRLNFPFAKLFKLSIINEYNIRFDKDISYGEDTLFVYSYLIYTNKVITYSYDGYHYICSNSVSLSKTHYKWDVYSYILNIICEQIESLERQHRWDGTKDKCIIANSIVFTHIRYIKDNYTIEDIENDLRQIYDNQYARLQIYDRSTYQKSNFRRIFDFLMKNDWYRILSIMLYVSRFI